ncbi:MAG: XrtA system polysaccharide chain length determinant [Methylococcales bacterium]
MQEQYNDLIFKVKGTLKYKWIALLLAWVICIAGWTTLMIMPNKYKSEAQVHVDTKSMLQPLLHGLAVEQDIRELVSVMKQLMFTQQNLEKIASLAKLDTTNKNDIQRYEMIQDLKKDIFISGMKQQSDLFSISYEAINPEQAKNVVLAVLTVFSEQTQASTLKDADSSQQFIGNQLKDLEVRLRNAEKARENFKRLNFGLLPDQEHNQMLRVHQLDDQLNAAKLALNEAEAERKVLTLQMQEVLASSHEWKEKDPTSKASLAETTMEELRVKKADLLSKYTDKHPQIIAIDDTLKELEKNKRAEDQMGKNTQHVLGKNMMENKYIQDLKMALNRAEAKVGSLQTKISFTEQQIKVLKEELNTRLTVETEMQNLNRDYDSIHANYKALLERREQASLSQSVDNESIALKFRIAEPPNKPLKPSSPNRLILSTVVLLSGLAIGFSLAFGLFYIKPTFMTTGQLREIIGLPVLGSVSFNSNDSILNKKQHSMLFTAVSSGLFIAYFGIMVFEFMRVKQVTIASLLNSF